MLELYLYHEEVVANATCYAAKVNAHITIEMLQAQTIRWSFIYSRTMYW